MSKSDAELSENELFVMTMPQIKQLSIYKNCTREGKQKLKKAELIKLLVGWKEWRKKVLQHRVIKNDIRSVPKITVSTEISESVKSKIVLELQKISTIYMLLRDNREYAYQSAADSIKKNTIFLDKLTELPRIGKAIKRDIEEIISYNHSNRFNELTKNEDFKLIIQRIKYLF
uniref:Uncharacterized protein n=1 Tax=viral metagenome TaxID=1070528 RepID=A0A6C0J9W0_9ZZZZ